MNFALYLRSRKRKVSPQSLKGSDIAKDVKRATDYDPYAEGPTEGNLYNKLLLREKGEPILMSKLLHNRIPSTPGEPLINGGAFFVGKFSPSGDRYFCASRDNHLRLFETDTWKIERDISAIDSHIGWGFRPLDADYSPDNKWVIYSSRNSHLFYLVSIDGDWEVHKPMNCEPQENGLFSINFSPDSAEILIGCADCNAYLFDLNLEKRTDIFAQHHNDVNSTAFFDDTAQKFLTGSDDCNIHLWDRRASSVKPAESFSGHEGGVNYLCPKKDGRYFLSSSKDQTIQLWDIRKPGAKNSDSPNSIMTYTGHEVHDTLIRCYFSPLFTTGQRYVITGSIGEAIIYDLLTGTVVEKLKGHRNIVRDPNWHPYLPKILTASFDGTIGVYE